MQTTRLVTALALSLGLAACTPEVCEEENLPFQGLARTPEDLFTLAQYGARNDCCGSLYDALSPRTRDEHSQTKFCLFWDSDSLALPEPYEDYTVAEIVRGGTYQSTFAWRDPASAGPFLREGESFVYVEYQEPGKPNLLAQLLLVPERLEDGSVVPRLALQEMIDRRIPFDAGR